MTNGYFKNMDVNLAKELKTPGQRPTNNLVGKCVRIIPVHQTHYNNVIMIAMASQFSSLTIVYSTVYSGTDQRKHQSSASLAFVRGIHRWPVNSPHKWPVARKMLPFDDVIMPTICLESVSESSLLIRLLHIESEDISIVVMSLILTTTCIFFQAVMNNILVALYLRYIVHLKCKI